MRTRVTPSAAHSPTALTFQPWRYLNHNRYSSTGQELKSVQNYDRTAAMLHGRERNGGKKEVSKRPPPEYAASNPSPQQSATPSRRNAQTPTQFKQLSNRAHRQAQQGQLSGMSRKRKATTSPSQRPATRQRSNYPNLKDEAYIRKTMRIPTPEEYPDAPKTVFKTPKASMYSLAQNRGFAECRSEFTVLAADAHQCTAYYNSAMHNQVVVGEGRTKASHSTSCRRVY